MSTRKELDWIYQTLIRVALGIAVYTQTIRAQHRYTSTYLIQRCATFFKVQGESIASTSRLKNKPRVNKQCALNSGSGTTWHSVDVPSLPNAVN